MNKQDISLLQLMLGIGAVLFIASLGYLAYTFEWHKDTTPNCIWISDKGVKFTNESRVIDLLKYIDAQHRANITAYSNKEYGVLAYSYDFKQDNFTFKDAINKKCTNWKMEKEKLK